MRVPQVFGQALLLFALTDAALSAPAIAQKEKKQKPDSRQSLLKMEFAKAIAVGCGKSGDLAVASFHMPTPQTMGSLLSLCGGDHLKADAVIDLFLIFAKNKGCSRPMFDAKTFQNDDAGLIEEEATRLVRRFSCG